jgi:MSHA pilin protein MshB
MSQDPLQRPLTGFSLVELVAVIAIVGILAVVALPRFVDVTSDARNANLAGTSGAFKAGVDLAHARWIAKGATASVDSVTVEGGGSVGVNDAGWPENGLATGGDGVVTAAECVDLWSRLLTAAPGISATAGAADWQASVQGTTTCRFADPSESNRYFEYQSTTGTIVASIASSNGSTGASTPASAASGSSGSATPSSSSTSGSPSAATPACGLVGFEPLLILLIVRRWRRPDSPREP